LRRSSATFGKHVSVMLSAENGCQLWVPKGFAHGFCTLEPLTEVLYKVTDYYDPQSDRGVAWNDPSLEIAWPVLAAQAVISERDGKHPKLADISDVFD
jgi:dTDP-4-dehydrorhamnose 3,5-epimerase